MTAACLTKRSDRCHLQTNPRFAFDADHLDPDGNGHSSDLLKTYAEVEQQVDPLCRHILELNFVTVIVLSFTRSDGPVVLSGPGLVLVVERNKPFFGAAPRKQM